MKPTEFKPYFGEARMVTVTSNDTTIIDGKGNAEDIENRLNDIKTQIDLAKSNFEIEKLQERLGKLTGGVAIINVGGISEVEMKEKKDRVDDALHATKAALDQGIVPGGGIALVIASESLKDFKVDNQDQQLGVSIVRKSLIAPFNKILLNAGIEDYHEVLNNIRNLSTKWGEENPDVLSLDFPSESERLSYSKWFGYNVKSGEYVNFLEVGIIDPTKVTRTALENAASVAGTILTTESVIYSVGEKKKEEIDYSQFM
jgi:chaperonin GroEL